MRGATRVLVVLLCTAACGGLTQCGVIHAQAAPVLSDLERAKLEGLQARVALAQLQAQYDGCRAELGTVYNALGTLRAQAASQSLTAAEEDLKAFVEQHHAGYTWDPKTGTFTKKGA